MLLCELAAFYKDKGMTLYDGLQELYGKYGFYKESTKTIVHEGIEGAKRIKGIMNGLRQNLPEKIGDRIVVAISDYKSSIHKNILTGAESKITLPVSDVMYYEIEDGSWFCVRPSGTEPKIKIYFGVKGASKQEADAKHDAFIKDTLDYIG